jgi:hypothetical protein
MSNLLANHGISAEREAAMWREQNRKDLLYSAFWPLAKKIEAVEEMIKLARSMHGGKLPSSPDEHEEISTW